MAFVGIVLVSFAPGLFWLWFYVRKDVYRPEPRRLIAITFGLGCLSTIPAGMIEAIFLFDMNLEEGAALTGVAAAMLLVVGPVEETCKFAAVRFKPYRSLYFDEPMDGLVYAVAASLGFASLENMGHVLAFGPAVMIGRAPITTVAHLVLGSVWGYALGVHQASGYRRSPLVAGSLVIAACAHGVFNILVFSSAPLPLGAVVLTVIGAVWAFGRFKWGQRVSPFRLRRNYPKAACPSCGELIRVVSRFCRSCGMAVAPRAARLFCGRCGEGNRPDAGYCTSCGDRLLRA